jgi:hypothetical protein
MSVLCGVFLLRKLFYTRSKSFGLFPLIAAAFPMAIQLRRRALWDGVTSGIGDGFNEAGGRRGDSGQQEVRGIITSSARSPFSSSVNPFVFSLPICYGDAKVKPVLAKVLCLFSKARICNDKNGISTVICSTRTFKMRRTLWFVFLIDFDVGNVMF